MIIAPMRFNDLWYGRIQKDGSVPADTLQRVPVENTVEMELVEILHSGPEENYRPLLHLRGELLETQPSVTLPYGITGLNSRRGSGSTVDAFYDFSRDQLVGLVTKGYFTEGFEVPPTMSGIPWVLPGTADFFVVGPSTMDEPPLVFMDVHDETRLELDQDNSGYDPVEYFPDHTPQAEAVAQPQQAAPQATGAVRDMFSDVAFEAAPVAQLGQHRAPVTSDGAEGRPVVPDSVFERLVAEAESRLTPETPVVVEVVPSDFETFYDERVAPGVAAVLSAEPEAQQTEVQLANEARVASASLDEPVVAESTEQVPSRVPAGYIDFSEDEPEAELAPLYKQMQQTEAAEQRAANERRVAEVRASLSDDGGEVRPDDNQPEL